MKLKIKLPVAAVVIFLAVSLICLGAKPGWNLYRLLDYHMGGHTQAEKTVMDYAQETGIPYGTWPRSLIALLERNPETRDFVLGYPHRDTLAEEVFSHEDDGTVPLLMQWDPRWGYETYGSDYLAVTGCGPTCLAMAGLHLTGDENFRPDRVAGFAERNGYYASGYGSSWTLISEGAEKLGLAAKELPLVKKKITDALEAGSPVILAMGPGDFTSSGHYILLSDLEDGLFRVNDPNSCKNSEKLWSYEELESQIRNIWAISLSST